VQNISVGKFKYRISKVFHAQFFESNTYIQYKNRCVAENKKGFAHSTWKSVR